MNNIENIEFYQIIDVLQEGTEYFTIDTDDKNGKYNAVEHNLRYAGKYMYSRISDDQKKYIVCFNNNDIREEVLYDVNTFFLKRHMYEVTKKPVAGREYYTSDDTVMIDGKYYLTKNNLHYVGKYILSSTNGINGGFAVHYDIFDNDGIQQNIVTNSRGYTCYIEKNLYDEYQLDQDEKGKEYYNLFDPIKVKRKSLIEEKKCEPLIEEKKHKPLIEEKKCELYIEEKKQVSMCEVFRQPEVGKVYYTTIDTIQENKKYYSPIDKLRYVGKYLYHASSGGYGDSCNHYAVFDNDGKQEYVTYDYEGKTCFLEVVT